MARTAGSQGARTRDRIRRAALRLIARTGFNAMTMRQLAEEAGIQSGTIYRYFPSKQAILFEILDTHMDEVLAAWSATRPQGLDPLSELEAFVRFHISYHVERRNEVFLSYMELRNLEPENYRVIQRKRREYERLVEEILERGVAEERFRLADLRLTTLAILAMLTGVTSWYRPEGRLPQESIERIHAELVAQCVRPPGMEGLVDDETWPSGNGGESRMSAS